MQPRKAVESNWAGGRSWTKARACCAPGGINLLGGNGGGGFCRSPSPFVYPGFLRLRSPSSSPSSPIAPAGHILWERVRQMAAKVQE